MADYIIQLEDVYTGNSIRINEIQFKDASGTVIPYTIVDAYDSTKNGIPHYWNNSSTGVGWGKVGLNDGNKTYSSASSTVLLYDGVSSGSLPVAGSFVRIKVFLSIVPHKVLLNFVGVPSGVAKTLSLFKDFTFLNVKDNGVAMMNKQSITNTFTEQTFSVDYKKFALIRDNQQFIKYSNSTWQVVASSDPVELEYFNGNTLSELSHIPESAWSQLQGEVEICYYTDDPAKTEVSFNIETEPFTLAQEWEDKEIKIIEYTDDPNQTESTITIETEPFTLYDELGDSVDVLYYTDNPAKTTAELNFTANYSPLDELEGDFDVVTWTNDEEVIAGNRDMSLSYDALPFEQIIVQPTDVVLYGDLKKLVASKIVDSRTEGTLRVAASFDSGLTWKTYRFDKWVSQDIQNTTLFKRKGMSVETLNTIPEQDLPGLTRIAYYFDNSEHYENSYALDQVKMVVDAPRQTVAVQQMALQILNTTATVDLTFTGNKLQGVLDDADKGKVKYRVLLNGQPYYPAGGEFTRLLSSPFKIEINIDERKFLFGKENTLKVEFQDYWGTVEAREFSFVGTFSGLMFMDESGDFLSDTFGGILKQLDYEVIIAGQTTLTKKVKLINQLGYAVDHVYLEMDKKFQTSGVEVQLSRQADPFLPIDYLTYGLMEPEESVDFYVRIATDIHAKPDPNGIFEMKVKADRV